MTTFGLGLQGTSHQQEILDSGCKDFLILDGDVSAWYDKLQGSNVHLRFFNQHLVYGSAFFQGKTNAGYWLGLPAKRPSVVLHNESNLWYEVGLPESQQGQLESAEGFNYICDRLYELYQGFRSTARLAELHFPAMSPGHGEVENFSRLMPAMNLCQVIDVHYYLGAYNRVAEYVRLIRNAFPDKPIWITEFNHGDDSYLGEHPTSMVQDLTNFCWELHADKAFWFLANTDDPKFKQYALLDYSEHWHTYLKIMLEVSHMDPRMDKLQQTIAAYPELYAAWGGDFDDFYDHLKAIGALPVDRSDVAGIADRAKSKVQQLVEVLRRLS